MTEDDENKNLRVVRCRLKTSDVAISRDLKEQSRDLQRDNKKVINKAVANITESRGACMLITPYSPDRCKKNARVRGLPLVRQIFLR